MSVKITSAGSSVGNKVLDNFMLKEMVDTSDEWIKSRTGIEERRIAEDITTEELASQALKRAIDKAGIDPSEIGLLIVATISSDTKVPSSAYMVAGKLGLKNTVCFDINAACSGFIYSVSVAKSMMKSMGYKYAAVIGAEKLSKYVNWEDRSTCVLFGDGAGCAILENTEIEEGKNHLHIIESKEVLVESEEVQLSKRKNQKCNMEDEINQSLENTSVQENLENTSVQEEIESRELEIIDEIIGGYYDSNRYLTVNSREGISDENVSEYIEMNGRQVYKFATHEGEKVLKELMERNAITNKDVEMVISHQANKRIIETLSLKTGIEIEKWFINLNKYGNTSSASIPLALDESIENLDFNKEKGKYILSVAFGGGLSYGAILLKIV